MNACSGYRQAARSLEASPSTVLRQVGRLGRHCLLFHEQLRPHGPPAEPLVIDGFVTYEFSQYTPFELHLAVGSRSHFLYGFTDSELRRSGRMSPRQRRRRTQLERRFGRPPPRAAERAMANLLAVVLPPGSTQRIDSDDHPAYPRALRRLAGRRIRHRVTSSRVPRTPRNPLFPVNLMDLLIRHSSANHKRETIAFSKRRQSAVERLAIFQVWRNTMKSLSERRQDATPADDVLAKRLFPTRIRLPAALEPYYRRSVPTRHLPRIHQHRLQYAD
jgi:hypothetical protein